jgi:hypothetical protein
MRKLEQDMIAAVQSCLDGSERTWRSGNTEVSTHHHGVAGTPGYERTVVVRLHDNVIAEFDSALNGDRGCRGLKLRDSGWQTNTTKSRLNALLGAFRDGSSIYQKQGQWHAPDGTEWTGVEWFTYQSMRSVYDVEYKRALALA